MDSLKVLFSILVFFFIPYIYSQDISLKIYGENEKENIVLDSVNYTKTHKDLKSVYVEFDMVQKLLIDDGYLNLSNGEIIKVSDTTFYGYLHLGKKIRKHRIGFDDVFTISAIESLGFGNINIKNNSIEIDFHNTEAFLNTVVNYLEEKGNPFAEVKLVDIGFEDNKILSHLKVITNQVRKIDEVVVKGYENFPKSFITYNRKLKKGVVYTKSNILKASENIAQLSFVEEIKKPEILFTKDSTTVFLYLKKVNTNYFDGFLGFGSDENTGNLKLNGFFNIQLLNNLNVGEQLNLTWRNNGNGQTDFNAAVSLPYIFKLPIGVDASLNIFKKDSTFSTTNTNFGINYKLNFKNKLGISFSGVQSNNLLNSLTNPEVQDFKSNFISLNYTFTENTDALNISAQRLKVKTEVSIGNRNSLENKTPQQRITIDALYQWKINPRNTIYLRNTTQSLFSDDFLENEKFRFGGINSIRGFNENSLEANLYSVLNTEYRYFLAPTTFVHSIIDVAYIQDDVTKTTDNLFGFGFGLGIASKNGLFRFNYAIGIANNTIIKLSASKIHISYATFF